MNLENSCGSGYWCGSDLGTLEMSFPNDPNGCNGDFGQFSCTDATPRYATWVVRVHRTSGAANCSTYTVRISNQ